MATRIKVLSGKCPICKKEYSTCFCPNCGIPLSTNDTMRPEYKSFNKFQYCDKCWTKNPYQAKYCRNCGEDITLHAKDKNGHGWVDLGLSVLWATESLPHHFLWNDNTIIHENHDYEELRKIRDLYIKSNYGEIRGKDAATHYWGEKWRTPTKEDFEELITKCKWEKYIIPTTNKFALKAIGLNGNSIIFPINPLIESNYGISLWSSTKEDNIQAYAFRFYEKVEYKSTLTAKQKKRMEFAESNETRFKVDLLTDEWLYRSFEQRSKMIEEKRRKIFPQYEMILEQQRKILDAMGDDSHEIEYNKKEDLKRWHNLWLTTPIRITISANPDNDISSGTIRLRSMRKIAHYGIRPIADKKWQGKL